MNSQSDDLEQFKLMDLRQYAAGYGYYVDEAECWKGHTVMRHADGDKIVIAVSPKDGHYVYCSFRDSRQSGSIVDFVFHRQGCRHIGQAIGELRSEAEAGFPASSGALPQLPALEPVYKDLNAVRRLLGNARPLSEGVSPYLNELRGLRPQFLAHSSLADAIRVGEYENCLFPHYDFDGVCGAEVKNKDFTGFAEGGTKGVWHNGARSSDDCLALFETAIDALSWGQINGLDGVRLLSTAGSLNPTQPRLITSAIEKLPRGKVVIGFDNDEAGDTLAEIVRSAFGAADNSALELVEDRPPHRGFDWNDYLQGRRLPDGPLFDLP